MSKESYDNEENQLVPPEMPERWREMLETQRFSFQQVIRAWESRPLSPPWVMFPEIPRSSIGWRMGGGETYLAYFGDRYRAMPSMERLEYRATYPEPEEWQGFYQITEDQGSR